MADDALVTVGFHDPIDIELMGRLRSVKVTGMVENETVAAIPVSGSLRIEEGATQGPTLRLGQVFMVEIGQNRRRVVANWFNLMVREDDLDGGIGWTEERG